jgi:DNA replication protein DnaC
MLTHPPLDRLRQLRLPALAEAGQQQQQDPTVTDLPFDDRLTLLVEAEWLSRQNHRLHPRRREAYLRLAAAPADVDYHAVRGLVRGQFQQWLSTGWVTGHQVVLITGPAAVGKTFLACTFGHAACRHDYRVRYIRVSRLLGELVVARLDHTYAHVLRTWAKTDVVILEDWGEPLTAEQARDLGEVLDARYGRGATIVTSQVPVAQWHALIPDATTADAILDRLVHHAYRIDLKGDSLRQHLSAGDPARHPDDYAPTVGVAGTFRTPWRPLSGMAGGHSAYGRPAQKPQARSADCRHGVG